MYTGKSVVFFGPGAGGFQTFFLPGSSAWIRSSCRGELAWEWTETDRNGLQRLRRGTGNIFAGGGGTQAGKEALQSSSVILRLVIFCLAPGAAAAGSSAWIRMRCRKCIYKIAGIEGSGARGFGKASRHFFVLRCRIY